MKIAILNEVSSCARNGDIARALEKTTDAEILNLGMHRADEQPELTYIGTATMAAILLNTGAADFVVGGCGTGQGFLNAVLQFPGVVCGLISDPLDAWLFSQINGGNCISLPLNKGYGWAADVNLEYLFEKLFKDPSGAGYPPHRAESQAASRALLADISRRAHHSMTDILRDMDPSILRMISANKTFMDAVRTAPGATDELVQLLQNA
ncbi:MAG: RpiB/LacA/LacB family sugar-phosphate isomerase [Aristaeellaceae bacterium]